MFSAPARISKGQGCWSQKGTVQKQKRAPISPYPLSHLIIYLHYSTYELV